MLFGRSSYKKRMTLLLDVSDDRVVFSLVHYDKKNNIPSAPDLHFVTEVLFDQNDVATLADAYLEIQAVIKKGVASAIAFGSGAPAAVHIVLDQPWYFYQSVLIEQSFTTTKKIDARTYEELIASHGIDTTDPLYKAYEETYGVVAPVERKITSMMLNGYPTNDPIGKKCTKIACNAYLSVAPKMLLENIRTVLESQYHTRHIPISFHSRTVALGTVVRSIFPHERTLAAYHVASTTSTLSIFEDNACFCAITVPFGADSIALGVAKELKISKKEAETYVSLALEKKLIATEAQKIEAIFSKMSLAIQKNIIASVQSAKDARFLPETVVLVAPYSTTAWFSEIFKGDAFRTFTLGQKNPTVIVLSSSFLVPYVHALTEDATYALPKVDALFVNSVQ